MSSFKMKTKPEVPERKTEKQETQLYSGMTLRELVDWAGNNSIDDCEINSRYKYDGYEYFLECSHLESDEEYKKRYDKYLIKLEIYNRWVEDNKGLIEQKKQQEKLERLVQKEKQIEQLEKQLKKLRKEKVDD